MNTPLRRRHAVVWGALALALPAGLAAALAARTGAPVVRVLPPDPRASTTIAPLARERGIERELTGRTGERWRVRHEAMQLAIAQIDGDSRPDLLAYWAPELGDDELPKTAVLLGPVSATERTFATPRAGGALVLFSLAHGEWVAHTTLEAR